MAKFNYKKWVTENKYSSLNEQNTQTCYGCLNYSSDMSGQFNYIDMSEVVTVEWDGGYPSYPQNVIDYFQSSNICGPQFYFGDPPSAPNGNYGTVMYYYTSMNALEASGTCSGSITGSDFNTGGNMDSGETGLPDPGTQLSASIAALYFDGPVCCDPDAQNYGQNASGTTVMMAGTYPTPGNYQPGGNATDTYLMTNQGTEYQTAQGEDICNNNLCQGDVNEPDTGGQGAPDQGPVPQPLVPMKDPQKTQQVMKKTKDRVEKNKRRGGTSNIPRQPGPGAKRLKEIKNTIKEALKKLNLPQPGKEEVKERQTIDKIRGTEKPDVECKCTKRHQYQDPIYYPDVAEVGGCGADCCTSGATVC